MGEQTPSASLGTPTMKFAIVEELKETSALASEIMARLGCLKEKEAHPLYFPFYIHFATLHRISEYELGKHAGTETDKPLKPGDRTPLQILLTNVDTYLTTVHFSTDYSVTQKLRVGVELFDAYSRECYRHLKIN